MHLTQSIHSSNPSANRILKSLPEQEELNRILNILKVAEFNIDEYELTWDSLRDNASMPIGHKWIRYNPRLCVFSTNQIGCNKKAEIFLCKDSKIYWMTNIIGCFNNGTFIKRISYDYLIDITLDKISIILKDLKKI